ncbi:MAG TPA: discoidin domain-containing protein [Kiritimatiellia bacterium]|nr:discoidin domain-containing protein [Kiritimatiellia bacterium]HRU70934.1 discoidin domain-containing protein [Kiritimatiellia bacterium]
MKHTFMNATFAIGLFIAAAAVSAQDTAAQWAGKQHAALAAISDATLADLLKQGTPALDALFAEVKTGYASDPVALTRIAALTQYIMRPAGAAHRATYANALLAAAQRAGDADVICFFLDQLRWCGLPQQAAAIRAFEKSDKPGVATLAAMTVQAVTDDRAPKAAPVKPTRYAALNAELAAMPAAKRTPRLLAAFDDPDPAYAGVALAHARTTGGAAETRLWAGKLAAATDPVRKTMLLDLLGDRGDKSACAAVAPFIEDADDTVAFAARQALIRLDPAAFAARLPALLKALPPNRLALIRDGARQLKTEQLKDAVTRSYDSFSDTGKKVALELIKERRITEAARLGLAALNAKDEEAVIAGFRLLREIAGNDVADVLVAKTLASSGRVTPEAQNALAAAARRDKSGAYAAALAKALAAAPDAQKPVALESAARIGGTELLKAVEAALTAPQADVATAAVRALSAWPDAAALPVLLRVAAKDPDARRQTLAARGVAKLFNTQQVDKQALLPVWRALRADMKNDENRALIDDLFRQEINVALGKPVKTDAPTEGNNVPANLVDGTLEKAWHAGRSPAQAVIDLGATETLGAMHITFYHADGRTYTFKLELSTDGKAWKEVAGNLNDAKPATAEGLRLNFEPTAARYARLTVVKNSANFAVHVQELKLFAVSAL